MIPKFRAWDKRECEFVPYLRNIVLKHDGTIEGIEYEMPHEGIVYNDISYFELMQSTGLKDKHGVEIFEGDIIDKGYLNFSIENRIGYVQFSQGGNSDGWAHGDWLGWITNNNDSLLDVHEHCTVLGNKFEHLHLLEEE